MANGMIAIDICTNSVADILVKQISASKAYWTSKGYKLISDDGGVDFWRVVQSKLSDGNYQTGSDVAVPQGDVVLVYERIIG